MLIYFEYDFDNDKYYNIKIDNKQKIFNTKGTWGYVIPTNDSHVEQIWVNLDKYKFGYSKQCDYICKIFTRKQKISNILNKYGA